MADEFIPVIYLKKACPFSLKLRIALLDAGMLDDVIICEIAPETPEWNAVQEKLSRHFEKVSFPTAEIAPDEYRNESDDLIDHFTGLKGIDPGELPTLQSYKTGVFSQLMRLLKENRELRKRQGEY